MKGRQLLLLEMEELELMLLLRQSRQQKADKVPKIAKFFPETLPPAVCATLKIFCEMQQHAVQICLLLEGLGTKNSRSVLPRC